MKPNLPFPRCWFSMPDFPLLFVSDVSHLHFKDVCANSDYKIKTQKVMNLNLCNVSAQFRATWLVKVLAG